MSKFDALGLAVDVPARLLLLNPVTRQPLRDGEGNEAYIEVLSADSMAARQHTRKLTDQRLRSPVGTLLSAEQLEAEDIELFVKLTKGWYLVGLDGTPLVVVFSEANARELYSATSTAWIWKQVDKFLNSSANFVKASSNN